MWNEDYQWHYDYIRLAWDTGFSFEKCKSPNFDKNKICAVDVDRIVKERDVASVDRYISTVVQYILDEEQSKVLDINFVKLFKISQLAVEYLVFCKKYLDNTVVLLKKELAKSKEENKELKFLNNDLQKHVENLMRQQVFTTFKCTKCPKAFSSEEFLNSHIKRRHTNAENYNSETDKLNMEIKELKERLNNTEKLLKEQKEKCPENGFSDEGNGKLHLTQVLDRFEKFKLQVDEELKDLKVQKNFYEENYTKLFDLVVSQNKENQAPKSNDDKLQEKTENTTQTDKVLQIENVNNKNITEIIEVDKDPVVHQKIIDLKQSQVDSVEAKISTALAGIENQMQSFWSKLNELQLNQSEAQKSVQQPPFSDGKKNIIKTGNNIENVKPKVKPRSKFTPPTKIVVNNDTEKLKTAIEHLERPAIISEQIEKVQLTSNREEQNKLEKSSSSMLKRQSVVEYTEESDTSESASSVEEEESDSLKLVEQQKSQVVVSPQKKNVAKRSTDKVDSSKTLTNIEKDIEYLVLNRLQDLGISEAWTRLPDRSFNKAFEIINHQANLTKKTHKNFTSIKKALIEKVEQFCKSSKSKSVDKAATGKEIKQNIVKISYRPKLGKQHDTRRSTNETVNIRNRSLFETDSDSDHYNNYQKSTATSRLTNPTNHYDDMIEELRVTNDQISSDEGSKKDVHKGVLKNFPSVGSLSKKKVFFDLQSQSNKTEDVPVLQKTGGSTTSIASSILSDQVDNNDQEKKEKDEKEEAIRVIEKEFEDLSDFDLSV